MKENFTSHPNSSCSGIISDTREKEVCDCWQFSYIQTCIVVQKLFNYFFCHLCIINYRNYKQHWLKKEVICVVFLNYFTFTISSLLCNVM